MATTGDGADNKAPEGIHGSASTGHVQSGNPIQVNPAPKVPSR
jgi:hypothetical protein